MINKVYDWPSRQLRNGGGANEVLNYHITVNSFENYCNIALNYLYKYRHRSIFYQNLYFIVNVRWLKNRIPTIFYSNYQSTVQKSPPP